MLELLITKKSIALIFEAQIGIWKIAFGTDQKKVLPQKFTNVDSAIKESRRLGFGGYRSLSKNRSHTKTRMSMNAILGKEVQFKGDPTMFVDEKEWRLVYRRHVNTT